MKDIKLRTEILKMLRVNYLNIPISKNKSYFDLFYLNEGEFFLKLYEKNSVKNSKSNKITSIEKFAQILIYELMNFTDIISPYLEDKVEYEKNLKGVKYYIIDGILGSVKQLTL